LQVAQAAQAFAPTALTTAPTYTTQPNQEALSIKEVASSYSATSTGGSATTGRRTLTITTNRNNLLTADDTNISRYIASAQIKVVLAVNDAEANKRVEQLVSKLERSGNRVDQNTEV